MTRSKMLNLTYKATTSADNEILSRVAQRLKKDGNLNYKVNNGLYQTVLLVQNLNTKEAASVTKLINEVTGEVRKERDAN